ncbi:MAG: spore germination protein [Clostridia bacterium]|nr:spore germination protein [Clostridia bacterium]
MLKKEDSPGKDGWKTVFEQISEIFGFGKNSEAFELLETESGMPPPLGRAKDGHRERKKEAERSIGASITENEAMMRRLFRADINKDLIFRSFLLSGNIPAFLVYVNGMADAKQVSDFILRDGMVKGCMDDAKGDIASFAVKRVFTVGEAVTEKRENRIRQAILDGKTAVFIDGADSAVLMDTRGYEKRTVGEPQAEKVVLGPQEAFVENLRTNITLLRRILRMEDLVCEMRSAGGENGINAALLYREGITNITLVEEIKRRLARINTLSVIGTGIMQQLIEEHSLSPFPQFLQTERPDRAASLLMEGHVILLLDGSPYASVMPATVFTLMTSAEDAYMRRPQATVIRIVRCIGAVISILLPALFLSLALFHQGLLSTEVLTTVIASRKMVFAPIGAEMVFLLLVFQLIREAGMRVPGNIGQAIGIIGGLILGQAAVAANLASSVVLIVVALTGLGNFCIPDYETQLAASFFRLSLALAAWAGGLLGVACLGTVFTAWLTVLKSFGLPFLAPFAPKTRSKRPMILRGRIRMHAGAEDMLNTKEGDA